jgi:hypothetical protein
MAAAHTPDENDIVLQSPRHGGIFNHQVCCSFSVHVHDLALKQVTALELFSTANAVKFSILSGRLKKWNAQQLANETSAWLQECPALTGFYQFTMTEMIRQYGQVFDAVVHMGIRIPPLAEFLFCFLDKLYEDPEVASGRFSRLGRDRTASIVHQRLTQTLCEAMKVTYFPKHAPATSALWRLEPQVPTLGLPQHPLGGMPDILGDFTSDLR